MADDETASVELKPDAPKAAAPWLDLIAEAEKEFTTYQETCDKVEKLYADTAASSENADREFQIFWANLEVLKPSIYSRQPVPVVVPRFQNRKELYLKSAELLERSLVSSFEADDIDATMRLARDDLAMNARGVVWLRYETTTEDVDTGQIGEDAEPIIETRTVSERVCKDHLDRRDFLHGLARKWKEVPWVARRSWLTRKAGLKRFGDIFLKAKVEKRDDDEKGREARKVPVWEMWHKEENCVVWVSPGMDEVLDYSDPFLKLEGFFPCPRPAYGTLKPRTLKPVPDLRQYKDQIEEVNELTARISSLAESLRLKGFYPGGASDVGEAIEGILADQDNRAILVPISNLAMFGNGSGGLKDAIVWLPVQEVATVVRELVELRRQMIDDIYQITGISDIMRGSTEASETLGAQQLKSQYGSIRIRDRQNELIRLARDVTRIEAEIMAENFAPETLAQMAQMDDLPSDEEIGAQIGQITQQLQQLAADPTVIEQARANPQQAQQMLQQAQQQVQQLEATVTLGKCVQLFRDQRTRPFVLEIETDSTIQPDEDATKQRATEMVTAVGGYISQALPLVQQVPQAAPMVGSFLTYLSGQYRAGRELLSTIDEFVEQMKQVASQPPQPNPEAVKAQAEAEAKAAEGQQRLAEQQQAAEAKAQEYEMRLEELRQKGANDAQMAEIQRETATVNLELKRLDVLIKKADIAAKGMEESEDGEGVVDKSDGQTASIVQAVTGQSEALAAVMDRFTAAIEAMAANQSRPKSITTPDGRTYTATVN